MSRFILAIIAVAFVFTMPAKTNAQFFEKLKKHIEKKVENEAENRTNKKADEAVDKVFDSAEGTLEGKGNTQNPKGAANGQQQSKQNGNAANQNADNQTGANGNAAANGGTQARENNKPKVVWSKFDFVPGDKVIFEDEPSADEENGEFPSRWDLYKGSSEISEFNGENVIMFLNGGGYILPYLKDSDKDYLPDVFTIEFDVWFEKRSSTANRYFISLYDMKNQRAEDMHSALVVYPNGIEYKDTDKRYPGTEDRGWSVEPDGKWRHISIAYTKGKFKAYMDDTRLINIPHLKGNPTGLTIRGMTDKMYLKNVRIAAGGVKYYDSVLSDGKIIVNGIKFDVDKATLKPESMGPINKIYKLMKKKPDLNFSVEGHTDSDGDETHNQTLSEQRAKTVMDKLISMGIDANRLKYKGFGESKPIDTNETPEGKANNRRVEFVKF
ncbi:MAG: OmpA family protein [Chlorobi bacterium]|nr:OmpA family protein [Chlorobiota bacterium]